MFFRIKSTSKFKIKAYPNKFIVNTGTLGINQTYQPNIRNFVILRFIKN